MRSVCILLAFASYCAFAFNATEDEQERLRRQIESVTVGRSGGSVDCPDDSLIAHHLPLRTDVFLQLNTRMNLPQQHTYDGKALRITKTNNLQYEIRHLQAWENTYMAYINELFGIIQDEQYYRPYHLEFSAPIRENPAEQNYEGYFEFNIPNLMKLSGVQVKMEQGNENKVWALQFGSDKGRLEIRFTFDQDMSSHFQMAQSALGL
eukprot:TRINITY_DN114_c0_g2_i1.p1 TRINITY_DN114_c0_g2~~TRINITY_DN114_c0_g2_i1.p1  ORF type:complete len:207 (+),score=34.87 TRINITY_DN114_c0_g2_i1:498-1118(+)